MDMLEAIARPYNDLVTYVLSNPTGKRYPNGHHASERGRHGHVNVVHFCQSWSAMVETYPRLDDYINDRNAFATAFDMYNDLTNQGVTA